MKLQQIQYALEVARTGSISEAARKLFTSQSNVSKALYQLEQELGFVLFERSQHGITITEKGQQFLALANPMCDLMDQMHDLSSSEAKHTFFVATEHYSFCHEAFVKFCTEYSRFDGNINLGLMYGTKDDICNFVAKDQCNIGICMISSVLLASYTNKLYKLGLCAKVIDEANLYLRMSLEHPLAKAWQNGTPINFRELAKYPCVDYTSTTNTLNYILNEIIGISIIDIPKSIQIFDREYKKRIITSTDAWTIGTSYSYKDELAFKGTRILVPGAAGKILCIYKKGKIFSDTAIKYLELLSQELAAIKSLDKK